MQLTSLNVGDIININIKLIKVSSFVFCNFDHRHHRGHCGQPGKLFHLSTNFFRPLQSPTLLSTPISSAVLFLPTVFWNFPLLPRRTAATHPQTPLRSPLSYLPLSPKKLSSAITVRLADKLCNETCPILKQMLNKLNQMRALLPFLNFPDSPHKICESPHSNTV